MIRCSSSNVPFCLQALGGSMSCLQRHVAEYYSYNLQKRHLQVLVNSVHDKPATTTSSPQSPTAAASDACWEAVLAAKTLSSFTEGTAALIQAEKRKQYSVHRPTVVQGLRGTPSDYVKVMSTAKYFIRQHPHLLGDDASEKPVMIQLLDVFTDLWKKPLNAKALHGTIETSVEWMEEGEGAYRRVLAAALGTLAPRDAWAVVFGDFLMDIKQHVSSSRNGGSGQLSAWDDVQRDTQRVMSDVASLRAQVVEWLVWCIQQTGSSTVLFPSHVRSKIALVQSPEVVGAVVASLVVCGTPEDKRQALEVVDAFSVHSLMLHAQRRSSSRHRDDLAHVLLAASDAAAVAGDSELVTRLVFQAFRTWGALGTDTPAAATPTVSSSGWRFWLQPPVPLNTATHNPDSSFDAFVSTLLRRAARSAAHDCGCDHAVRLVESLSTVCSFIDVAGMSLELLQSPYIRQHQRVDVLSSGAVPHHSRALALLGCVTTSYGRKPQSAPRASRSIDDTELLSECIFRSMQQFFICGVHHAEIPVAENPLRALELFHRMPSGTAARGHARLYALAAATKLGDEDNIELLCREESTDVGRTSMRPALASAFRAYGILIQQGRHFAMACQSSDVRNIKELDMDTATFQCLCSLASVFPFGHPGPMLRLVDRHLAASPPSSSPLTRSVVVALTRQRWGQLRGDANAVLMLRRSLTTVTAVGCGLEHHTVVCPAADLLRNPDTSSSCPHVLQLLQPCISVPLQKIVVVHNSVLSETKERRTSTLRALLLSRDASGDGCLLLLLPWQYLASDASAQKLFRGVAEESESCLSSDCNVRWGVIASAATDEASCAAADALADLQSTVEQSRALQLSLWCEANVNSVCATLPEGVEVVSSRLLDSRRTMLSVANLLCHSNAPAAATSKRTGGGLRSTGVKGLPKPQGRSPSIKTDLFK